MKKSTEDWQKIVANGRRLIAEGKYKSWADYARSIDVNAGTLSYHANKKGSAIDEKAKVAKLLEYRPVSEPSFIFIKFRGMDLGIARDDMDTLKAVVKTLGEIDENI